MGADKEQARAGAEWPAPETLSRDERSMLLYAETVCVDYGGLLEGIRMNAEDMAAGERFAEAGLMRFGRIPASLLGNKYGPTRTHWVELTPEGWALAHQLRIKRAGHRGPLATEVFATIAAKATQP